jgi:hypothetical protein
MLLQRALRTSLMLVLLGGFASLPFPGGVEASGAVGCIEAAAVQVLSADGAAAARHEGQPAEARCVGRWVAVPLSGRPEVLRYAGPWVVVPP